MNSPSPTQGLLAPASEWALIYSPLTVAGQAVPFLPAEHGDDEYRVYKQSVVPLVLFLRWSPAGKSVSQRLECFLGEALGSTAEASSRARGHSSLGTRAHAPCPFSLLLLCP